MIDPNFDLLMWFIFIAFCLRPFLQIYAGATGMKKSTHYDGGDIFVGLINLGLVILIVTL